MLKIILVWISLSLSFVAGWVFGYHFGWYRGDRTGQRKYYVDGDEPLNANQMIDLHKLLDERSKNE